MPDTERADFAVLLGAGASVDAGIPASVHMTEAIVTRLTEPSRLALGQALSFAVGALVAHDTARGSSPYLGIDVERLFSAVQMLAERDDLEIAPFVRAWEPALDIFESAEIRWSSSSGRDLLKAVESKTPANVDRALRKLFNSQRPGHKSQIFRRLQEAMLLELRRLANLEPGQSEYLSPILDIQSPITVATLNYDLSVELMAESKGAQVDTGIDSWRSGREWTWDEAVDIRLLKLHGSINWCRSNEGPWAGAMPEERVELTLDPVGDHRSPFVVFGQRGKLRADGPFLAMLREFSIMLANVRHLLVVGYSFRDEHINVAIARWLNASTSNRITVIDPAFPDEDSRLGNEFQRRLLATLSQTLPQPRLAALRMGAAVGLTHIHDISAPRIGSATNE